MLFFIIVGLIGVAGIKWCEGLHLMCLELVERIWNALFWTNVKTKHWGESCDMWLVFVVIADLISQFSMWTLYLVIYFGSECFIILQMIADIMKSPSAYKHSCVLYPVCVCRKIGWSRCWPAVGDTEPDLKSDLQTGSSSNGLGSLKSCCWAEKSYLWRKNTNYHFTW